MVRSKVSEQPAAVGAAHVETPALIASDVVVRFGGLVALDQVTLEARPGIITGLIGPNGAGKTTLFNVCSGFQRTESGRVSLGGHDITRSSPAERARAGLGRTFQRQELFRSLTVRDNVKLAVEAREVGRNPITFFGLASTRRRRETVSEQVDGLLKATGLVSVADVLAGNISTGRGRLVELARALARQPRFLLLDEPSSGLDTHESEQFGRLLVTICSERQIGILIVEHDMSLVLEICSEIHVLDFGQTLMVGSPDEIRTDPRVRRAYLGSTVDL